MQSANLPHNSPGSPPGSSPNSPNDFADGAADVSQLDVAGLLRNHWQGFNRFPQSGQKLIIAILRALLYEDYINQFLDQNKFLKGFDFIDKIFEQLGFSYTIAHQDLHNIPTSGRIVIIANHPLGALDGLALLRLVGSIRPDVRIVVNDVLMHVKPLANLFLPIDNFRGETSKNDIVSITGALENEEAVIIFPEGEVTRSMAVSRRLRWKKGFLQIARKMQTPIVPIYVKGRNSNLFYLISRFSDVASLLLLPREMIKHKGTVAFTIGASISPGYIQSLGLSRLQIVALMRKHLYGLGKKGTPVFRTERSIIHPRDRRSIRDALMRDAELLGETFDGKKICLFDSSENSMVMEEIARLREVTFRAIGEGTGRPKDLDRFDHTYRHIILWDEHDLEIAGAYRMAETFRWGDFNWSMVYSTSIFEYSEAMRPVFARGAEMGRSFVQAKYWGQRSLDYLWQGIGAYLQRNPEVRYLFGPVSISARYPRFASDMIVYYYRLHFPDPDGLVRRPITPYVIEKSNLATLQQAMPGVSAMEDFRWMKTQMDFLGFKIPPLFKQYADLCEQGGVRFCDFAIDSDFANSIDGMVLVDLDKLKPKKRQRYMLQSFMRPEEVPDLHVQDSR